MPRRYASSAAYSDDVSSSRAAVPPPARNANSGATTPAIVPIEPVTFTLMALLDIYIGKEGLTQRRGGRRANVNTNNSMQNEQCRILGPVIEHFELRILHFSSLLVSAHSAPLREIH